MKKKSFGKKLLIFIVLFVLLSLLTTFIRDFILPIKVAMLTSVSMSPAYAKWDVLFYKKVDSYTVGEVIIYPSSRRPVVTRIIVLNDDRTYTAKGDNNAASIRMDFLDETRLEKDKVIGKVIGKTSPFVYVPLVNGIKIIIALLLVNPIYLRMRRKSGK